MEKKNEKKVTVKLSDDEIYRDGPDHTIIVPHREVRTHETSALDDATVFEIRESRVRRPLSNSDRIVYTKLAWGTAHIYSKIVGEALSSWEGLSVGAKLTIMKASYEMEVSEHRFWDRDSLTYGFGENARPYGQWPDFTDAGDYKSSSVKVFIQTMLGLLEVWNTEPMYLISQAELVNKIRAELRSGK